MSYQAADCTENVFKIPKRGPYVDGVDGTSQVLASPNHVQVVC